MSIKANIEGKILRRHHMKAHNMDFAHRHYCNHLLHYMIWEKMDVNLKPSSRKKWQAKMVAS